MFTVLFETTNGTFEVHVRAIARAWAIAEAQLCLPEGIMILETLVSKD